MVLASAAGIYMVYWLRPVLVPFVVACFIVSGVGPILNLLESRFGISRLIAAFLTFLFGVVLMGIFGFTIWASMVDLSANAGDYRQRVRELIVEAEDRLPFDLLTDDSPITSRLRPSRPSDSPEVIEDKIESKIEQATQFIDAFVRDGIAILSQALLGLVSTSVVVLIYVFFLLLGKPTFTDTETLHEIDSQIRGYLSLKIVISIFTGLIFGLTLWLFGVPMALSFGVLAFLLNFIPNIGPIVASLLPVPLILLDPSADIAWMIAVILAICAIQMASGNLVEPKVIGNSSDLHPVTVLLALMFWGMLWGLIGMFLATPITAATKIVMERFDKTKPLADILAGRWDEPEGWNEAEGWDESNLPPVSEA
ncbi:AI-2E family transporter [Roseiconus nitratireducens]|uniref:AI-2E family transporter n=2 Tax=Roseiconus nitratireducens TaxID=2605748 RepID=A0A5M6CV31_9BACT|nr:AI-2E family transporter [Roseiconus nitratireducens]